MFTIFNDQSNNLAYWPHLDGPLRPLVVERRRDVFRELAEHVAEVVEPISVRR